MSNTEQELDIFSEYFEKVTILAETFKGSKKEKIKKFKKIHIEFFNENPDKEQISEFLKMY